MTALLDATPGSLDEYLAREGGRGLERARSMAPDDLIAVIEAAGLRGRGGAGFPTATKWRAIGTVGTGRRYAVCNAAEGEPGTFKDRTLLRSNPYLVVEGLEIAALAVGASKAYLVTKETFDREIASTLRALSEMASAGMLEVPVDLVLGPDEYLLGEETGLLEAVERALPLPRVARPFMKGLFSTPDSDNPTLVNNAETLANVPAIVADGPEPFRRVGTAGSPGTMLFTLAGDVVAPGVYELPMGLPLRYLIEDIGGGCLEGRAVQAVLPGASNTVITAEMLDVPLDFEAMRAVGTGLGAGGFVVLDTSACIVEAAALFARFLWIESCAQCPACKLNSGAIAGTLGRIQAGAGSETDLQVLLERAVRVTDGQRCALPTGQSLLVQSLVYCYADRFWDHVDVGCRYERRLALPKIVDYDEREGRFFYDGRYARKLPDWTYASAPEAA